MSDSASGHHQPDELLAEVRVVPEALAPEQAAAYLSISVSKLHAMNRDGLLPEPAQLGERCPRWSRSELRVWMFAGAPPRRRWVDIRENELRKYS